MILVDLRDRPANRVMGKLWRAGVSANTRSIIWPLQYGQNLVIGLRLVAFPEALTQVQRGLFSRMREISAKRHRSRLPVFDRKQT